MSRGAEPPMLPACLRVGCESATLRSAWQRDLVLALRAVKATPADRVMILVGALAIEVARAAPGDEGDAVGYLQWMLARLVEGQAELLRATLANLPPQGRA